MKWVSFHTHTTYSYGDAIGPVGVHVDRVSDLGMSALFLSEHGNVNSHSALERECARVGIKPGYGVEAYLAQPGERRKFHIGLYAMDEEGYRNLNRIVTRSYIDAYQFPTVTWESLKKHANGIVVLSGCSDSLISCSLLGGKSFGEKRETYTERQRVRTRNRIQRLSDVFHDRLYLEVQRFPGLPRTCTLNPAFAEFSNELGVPLLATADVHYPFPYQNKLQKVLHASRRKSSVAITEAEWEYGVLLTYPESDKEILNDLIATGLSKHDAVQSILNTKRLSERCNVELPKSRPLRFPVPAGTSAYRIFQKEIEKGWKTRVNQRPELRQKKAQYQSRILMESKVIRDKDFCDYFLATADLVMWAKGQGIAVGPGRGSAVSSLVCYLLGITEIDPLTPPFDKTIFERFLDPTRNDPPDIDLDFDDDKRHLVTQRAREIYGEENVANVANHIGYRGVSSLNGVARAYGLSPKTFEAIAKRITDRTETDERVDDTILDVLQSYASDPEVASLAETFPDQLQAAIEFEGNEHSMGVHAGGFVIATDPIPEVCAIYTKEKGTGRNRVLAQVIPYDKRDAEYLNMLKMDFLGLTTMGMIGICAEWGTLSMNEIYLLFYRAPEWEHQRILEMFQIDDVTGIFQFEGGTTRALTRRVKPATFDELAACTALSRPGPYYGGQAEAYIAVKHGDREMQSIHPNFDKHVEWTYGQIVYQEQIMRILRDVAGFDVPTVLRVRKIIGKKLGEHQFVALWDGFRRGCETTSQLSEDEARNIWSAITTAAGYAFNIPHAYSYTLISWWQSYLKLHFTTEFFAASLAKNGDGKKQIPRRTALLQDAQRNRLEIWPFTVTDCTQNWRPTYDPKGLQPGFAQIPNIGEAMADDMTKWVDTLDFGFWPNEGLSWDAMARDNRKGGCVGIGKGTASKLEEFANQKDPLGIHRTEDQIMAFRKQLVRGDFDSTGIPSADEFVTSANIPDDTDHVAFVGLVANIVYRDEVESIRTRTGQSVEEIKSSMDDSDKTKKATVFGYDEFGEVALRISRWQYAHLSGRLAQVKNDYHLVVAWGRTFAGRGGAIQVKNLWVFDPD